MCNLRLTLSMICLYRKMRQKGVRYESFLFPVCFRIVVLFAVVLEIVTQGVCLCVTSPRATSRKIAPFYFTRDKYFLVDFVPEKHLFVAYFAWKCKLLYKEKSHFYHKDLLRVYQKQNLALSLSLDLKQILLYYENTSVGTSLRKTLRCFNTVFRRPYRYFSFALVRILSMFYIQKLQQNSN